MTEAGSGHFAIALAYIFGCHRLFTTQVINPLKSKHRKDMRTDLLTKNKP